MRCNGCGNEKALHVRIGKGFEICDKCGSLPTTSLPDVFFEGTGYFDENLADKQHPKGQYIHSRRQKAEIIRKLGLREAGSDINPDTGKQLPYIPNPQKRRKFLIDNFGNEGKAVR